MKVAELEFGTFQFFPDVILGEINEGIHFDLELNRVLRTTVENHYGTDHKVAYISLRKNNYSIDPMVHHANKGVRQLTCVGIVETRNGNRPGIEIEAKFFRKGKLQAFYTAEEALVWASAQH